MDIHRIVAVKPVGEFALHLRFDDGTTGTVDLSDLAGRGVFRVWNDRKVFESVLIGTSGELTWSDSIDLCPDSLYLRLTGKKPREVFPGLKREPTRA